LEAEKIECAEFDRSKLMKALGNIRALAATTDVQEFLPKIKQELAKAGVAFVIAKPFGKIALSGVSRWLSPRKALIQLTLRHKSDDHFWFTLFHEAAHLLLHSRKTVFVDGRGKEATGSKEEEEEANSWAADFPIPRQIFSIFCQSSPTAGAVRRFAREIGVSPGIVVGQLQNAGCISFGYLNELKVRYQWLD
jgi:HTH-type transcriptional regulator/antitoxin HigA